MRFARHSRSAISRSWPHCSRKPERLQLPPTDELRSTYRRISSLRRSLSISIQRNIPHLAAPDCAKIHTRGGLLKLFPENDSENRRPGGCSIAAQDVHQYGEKNDGRERANKDSDRLRRFGLR